MKKIYKKCRS